MLAFLRNIPIIALILLLLAGCGSKISEPNYYRIQHGMTEKEVEDLLGPPHSETVEGPTSRPATTQPIVTKVKTWTRGGLTIRVVFENGVVVRRSAEGIPAEAGPSSQPVKT
jgi:hypothetical protein